MKHIKSSVDGLEIDAYLRYLRTNASNMPRGAREFALAPWHYDYDHHQCPHDSWLDKVTVSEIGTGPRNASRRISILARFLGAYHDGHFDIEYNGVSSYQIEYKDIPITISGKEVQFPRSLSGHGDWYIDEVSLTRNGEVCHEITFANGSTWKIVCADLIYSWQPIA